jgi:hypothetical protein
VINKKQQDQKKKQPPSFVRYTNQVTNTILRGMKMASPSVYDPNVNPLVLMDIIKSIGVQSLGWKPETFFAHLDKTYGKWDSDKISDAMNKFHDTGLMQTDVPNIVRHKIYAIRIILTSDTAHREWHIFEKIGSAFNGRLAHFGVLEPLSPIECAKTVAIIDAIRPDEFSHEVMAYIAASCHQEGLYTLKPSKYLKMSEDLLQMMNREETGRSISDKMIVDIAEKKSTIASVTEMSEDFVSIQAAKLLAIDTAAENMIKEV